MFGPPSAQLPVLNVPLRTTRLPVGMKSISPFTSRRRVSEHGCLSSDQTPRRSTLLGLTSTPLVTSRCPIRDEANTSGSPAAPAVAAATRATKTPATTNLTGDPSLLPLKCLQNIRGRAGFDVVGSPA